MKRTGLAAPDGATAPFEAMVPPPLGWFSRPVAALWVRRELFRRVLVRDIESSFRGSALGLLWIVLIPLVMVVLYTFVFGVVMKSAWAAETTSPFEVPLIYFAGLAVAGFFLEVVNRAPNTIRAHQSYVKKVIFPLDLLGWMLVGTAGVKLLISFSLLAIFLSVVEGRVALEVLYVPVLVAPLAVLLLGIAWILCAIGTYVRDLGHVLAVVAPVIMFVSPVFYALAQVPPAIRPVYLLNPLTFVLESVRQVLFLGGGVSWSGYGLYWLVAVLIFALGFQFFERARPGFADVV